MVRRPETRFTSPGKTPHNITPFVIAVLVGTIYFFSNPAPQHHFDYTFRVAESLLHARIGLAEQPPGWLNEFVPHEGRFHSVFPLGSVVTMIPFALLKVLGLVTAMPGRFIVALIAAGITYLSSLISAKYTATVGRRMLMVAGIPFGTWLWTNLTMASAWQLALGFAMLGQLGAIFYAAFEKRPVLAGAFFALGFGNRTEVLLTAPILIWLLVRKNPGHNAGTTAPPRAAGSTSAWSIVGFCVFPFLVGVATLLYNYVRFASPLDFGYARIPGVLNEPWYHDGIFSTAYIPRQAYEMLLKPWSRLGHAPFLVPNGLSASVLCSSPFLMFVLRPGHRDRALKYVAWAAICALTLVLWLHGNSGGWQFGYRYAIVLLPWILMVLLESSPQELSRLEIAAYSVSFALNAYATYMFHWTNFVRP
jgi:hypothetical protein